MDAIDYTKSLFRNSSDKPLRFAIPTQFANGISYRYTYFEDTLSTPSSKSKPFSTRLNPSRYEHFYIVEVNELSHHDKLNCDGPTRFPIFRNFLDLFAPYRFSSVIVDPKTGKRKLRYIFDTRIQTTDFLQPVFTHYPNIKVKAVRKQRYY